MFRLILFFIDLSCDRSRANVPTFSQLLWDGCENKCEELSAVEEQDWRPPAVVEPERREHSNKNARVQGKRQATFIAR